MDEIVNILSESTLQSTFPFFPKYVLFCRPFSSTLFISCVIVTLLLRRSYGIIYMYLGTHIGAIVPNRVGHWKLYKFCKYWATIGGLNCRDFILLELVSYHEFPSL